MKKFSLFLIILVAAIVTLGACSKGNGGSKKPAGNSKYKTITSDEAAKMMHSDSGVVILDVRTEEEFETGYIEGAILLPHTEIKNKAEVVLPDKDAVILIYCRSGNRSATAAQALVNMGYTNIYDFGGIIDWPGAKSITAEQAAKMMALDSDVMILDVRTLEEFEESHIRDAILLPHTEIKNEAETILPNKDAIILIYCKAGIRSAAAAKELTEMGYSNVYDFGGIVDWEGEFVE